MFVVVKHVLYDDFSTKWIYFVHVYTCVARNMFYMITYVQIEFTILIC